MYQYSAAYLIKPRDKITMGGIFFVWELRHCVGFGQIYLFCVPYSFCIFVQYRVIKNNVYRDTVNLTIPKYSLNPQPKKKNAHDNFETVNLKVVDQKNFFFTNFRKFVFLIDFFGFWGKNASRVIWYNFFVGLVYLRETCKWLFLSWLTNKFLCSYNKRENGVNAIRVYSVLSRELKIYRESVFHFIQIYICFIIFFSL